MTNKTFTILVFCLTGYVATAQDSKEKVMETRAREMHRVLCLDDKELWKKFIQENYSQALIDKPMKAKVDGGPEGGQKPVENQQVGDNLEAKTKIFQRLHQDFSSSKIVSIKPVGEKLDMVVRSDSGLTGTFSLKFGTRPPYLIDGLGIEVGN